MKQLINLPIFDFEKIKNKINGKNIILFGAGMYLEAAILSLQQKGLKPVLVIDNSLKKQNTKVLTFTIKGIEEAYKLYPDAIIIITTSPHLIQEISNQCKTLGWKNLIDCSCLLSNFEYNIDSFTLGVSQTNFDIDTYYFNYCKIFYPEKIIIKQMDIMITEKCSLKCKDCSNLMQYYVNPKHSDTDTTIAAIKKFMLCVDYVLEFRVLGGEPFIHKEAHKFINFLKSLKNKSRICIYTNGTIIPKNENLQSLISNDVFLRISDYGKVSNKVQDIEEVFIKNKVVYDVLKFEKWQDCARINFIEETDLQLEKKFSECCVQNYITLLNNVIYNCPFAANAHNIKAIPKFKNEYIDILNTNKNDIVSTIKTMIYKKKFYESCRFCPGRPLNNTPLEAALQVKEPMPFKSFL